MMRINGNNLSLCESWQQQLEQDFKQPYIAELVAFLNAEYQAGKTIYPAASNIFNALNTTSFGNVKVVILGQDPYHGPNQAHGLCFSVLPGVRLPPSLLNIFKEIKNDLGFDIPTHGCLQSWAEQGVLLLNATLTVEQAQAGSHQGKGWETFTDSVIAALNKHREGIVFLLWGSYAHKKGKIIDTKRHHVLKSVHPSPLSAHRGFFGNNHFSTANQYLKKQGQSEIDWRVPPNESLTYEQQ